MKIDPNLPPPPGVPVPASTDAEPSVPFEILLGGELQAGLGNGLDAGPGGGVDASLGNGAETGADAGLGFGAGPGVGVSLGLSLGAGVGPGVGIVAPARAFGFAEFGMFGRERQPGDPVRALPPGPPPALSFHAVLPIESLDVPASEPVPPSPDPAAPSVEPGQRPTRVAATPQARPHFPILSAAPADPDLSSPATEPAPAEEESLSAPTTARRSNPLPTSRSNVSLIMREKDGAVELVASGPALDPQSCALLRRLARTILARSGLDLVEFHLNGVPLAPDSMIMIGGSHGTRTR